jgi:hypothetical protein
MAFDASKPIDDRQQDEAGKAVMNPAGDLSLASPGEPRPGDECEREEEYQKAIRELLDRTCGLVAEAEGGASPAVKRERPAEAGRMAPPRDDAAVPGGPDGQLPIPSRAASTESPTDIETMREVARSSARQAIGLHRFQGLYSSACGKLLLALLALVGSAAAQSLTPRPSSAALAVAAVAWLAGACWTAQYLSATRRLAKLYSSAFGGSDD